MQYFLNHLLVLPWLHFTFSFSRSLLVRKRLHKHKFPWAVSWDKIFFNRIIKDEAPLRIFWRATKVAAGCIRMQNMKLVCRATSIETTKPQTNVGGFVLAPRVGLEPTTLRLTAACSTIELSRNDWIYIYNFVGAVLLESSARWHMSNPSHAFCDVWDPVAFWRDSTIELSRNRIPSKIYPNADRLSRSQCSKLASNGHISAFLDTPFYFIYIIFRKRDETYRSHCVF